MKEKSIWIDSSDIEQYPSLNKDITTDVLVIGGGICGVLCAYDLKSRGIDCVVVEKDRIGKGITKNTTAFISAQHDTLYQDLIKEVGIKKAKEYLDLNLEAIERYKKLSKLYDIDYKECNSSLYSMFDENIILKEKRALEQLGYQAKLIDNLPINEIKIAKGISFYNQATINPLKCIKELAKELVIYENSEVIKLTNNEAYLKDNKIKFNKVIIATHYPFKNVNGFYFTKLTQRRSYVVGFKYPSIEGTYCSVDEDGLYFRSYNDYLIVGGYDRNHKNECCCNFSEEIKKIFNDVKIDYIWSNQDCVSIDGIPYIGKHSLMHPNWYVASGFNLWGFTWAMASSFILSDLIQGKKQYELTNPHRFYLKKQLFTNIATSLKNIVNFKTPRCKHLGCALKYNKIEKVWECPCHGSRYDRKGNLLNGPSKRGINLD